METKPSLPADEKRSPSPSSPSSSPAGMETKPPLPADENRPSSPPSPSPRGGRETKPSLPADDKCSGTLADRSVAGGGGGSGGGEDETLAGSGGTREPAEAPVGCDADGSSHRRCEEGAPAGSDGAPTAEPSAGDDVAAAGHMRGGESPPPPSRAVGQPARSAPADGRAAALRPPATCPPGRGGPGLAAAQSGPRLPQLPGDHVPETAGFADGRPGPLSSCPPPNRKRSRSPSPPGDDVQARRPRYAPPVPQAVESGHPASNRAVADHYNARPDQGIERRKQSPIFRLRAFNNWVKTTLINYCTRGPGASVLDMGCGKGGDLNKWARARCGSYIGVDIAEVSVGQARERYQGMKGYKPSAQFFALDCFVKSLLTVLDPSTRFDIVSMQFCMHYSFESEAKVRMMLENVTGGLRPGGRYILTIPDARVLKKRLHSRSTKVYTVNEEIDLPEGPGRTSRKIRIHEFGNSIYNVKLKVLVDEKGGSPTGQSREEAPPSLPDFGARYSFTLQDAVDDCDEFVVEPRVFEKLAADYGLRVVLHCNFHEYYEQMTRPLGLVSDHVARENRLLLQRMKVVDRNWQQGSVMSEEEWEAAGLYAVYGLDRL